MNLSVATKATMRFCGRWAPATFPNEKKRKRELLTKGLCGMKGATPFLDRAFSLLRLRGKRFTNLQPFFLESQTYPSPIFSSERPLYWYAVPEDSAKISVVSFLLSARKLWIHMSVPDIQPFIPITRIPEVSLLDAISGIL